MTQDDPEDRLWQSLFATAFREHPYNLPVIGYREIFSSSTHDDLVAYYRARYVPNNLVVVVVGDIDEAAVEAAVGGHFGRVPRAKLAPVLVPEEPAQLAPRKQHRFEKVELTRAVTAWQVPGLSHPDAPVLDALAMVLGHGESSVLWQELRERAGLVHTIDASCWNPGTSGLFCVSYTCDPGNRVKAEELLERTLAGASRRFNAGQLRKALRQMIAGEVRLRQSMSGQASRLGAAEVVVGDLDYSRNYYERLRSVTPLELSRVLKTHLVAVRRTSVSINPAESGAASAAKSGSGRRAGSDHNPAGDEGSRPDFSEISVGNGARLVLQPDRRLPNLHLCLLVQGGPLFELAKKRGSSALLSTLLTKDTRRRSSAQVAQFIEEVGGSFYPISGNNSLGLAAEVLPPDADRALEVIAEAVLNPAFKSETFAIERDAQLAALLQDADDVVIAARKLLRRKFFGNHPLAIDAEGDEAGVKALAPADLAELHGRLFVARNLVLAVAGDIPARFAPKLKAFLLKLRTGAPLVAPPSGPAADGLPGNPGDFVEKQPREQAVVLQAYPGPRLHTPDYYVGEVADELFSGMASRLFERVREVKALAYFVRSSRVTGLDAAMFSFLAGTQPGKEAEVLAEIEAEIDRVQTGGVGEDELARCQTPPQGRATPEPANQLRPGFFTPASTPCRASRSTIGRITTPGSRP